MKDLYTKETLEKAEATIRYLSEKEFCTNQEVFNYLEAQNVLLKNTIHKQTQAINKLTDISEKQQTQIEKLETREKNNRIIREVFFDEFDRIREVLDELQSR